MALLAKAELPLYPSHRNDYAPGLRDKENTGEVFWTRLHEKYRLTECREDVK